MDSETLDDCVKKDKVEADFPSLTMDLVKKVNFKVSFFLFIMGIFLLSDYFTENCLPKSYSDGTNNTNTWGALAQITILVIFYIVIDLLVQGGII